MANWFGKLKIPNLKGDGKKADNVTGVMAPDWWTGEFITWLAVFLGLLLIVVGGLVGGLWGAAITAAAYIGLIIGTGFRIIPKQQFLVIERLGKFYRIVHDGPTLLLFIGLIDKVKRSDTLAFQSFLVYQGDKQAEIDFKDASAPVTANVWYAIGNPKDKRNISNRNARARLNAQIYAYTYAYADPHLRLKEVVDGFARPILQGMTLDEAQTETVASGKNSISRMLLNKKSEEGAAVQEAMKTLGAVFDPSKAFVLSDVDIPDTLQEARAARLIATAVADADSETGRGIREAIDAIMGESGDVKETEAIRTFMNRTGLKTVEQLKGANLQLVAENIGGVIRTLSVDKDKGGNE